MSELFHWGVLNICRVVKTFFFSNAFGISLLWHHCNEQTDNLGGERHTMFQSSSKINEPAVFRINFIALLVQSVPI